MQPQPRTQPQPQPRIVQPQQQPQSQARYQPQHQLQPDTDVEMADPVSSPLRASHQSRSSLSVPTIVAPAPYQYGSNFSNNSTRSRSRSPSNLAPPENELRASMALSTQCALSLATVAAELAPIPCIGVLVGCLTVVFQAVEKSRVNKEQWKLLQGRCVMVSRIAGAQVTNYGGEHYSGLQHASEILHDAINHIGERAHYWNQMHELLAFVQFQGISEEIRAHFSTLDSCLNLFSASIAHPYATDVAQMQWVGEFDAVQRREIAQLEQMRTLMNGMDLKLDAAANTQDTIVKVTSETLTLLQNIMDEKVAILQNQTTTPVATYADAQQIVQTIRTVTNMQLPTNLLVGRQCILDANVPIKTGVTCDIYSASFLTNEKVAKKVFRIGMSEKEHVERYAHRFLRDAKLWATFRSDYTLPFYGIGMEAFEGDRHFQLYMVSPLMKNFDAVTYLKQHKKNLGMKEGIMRIITDAAKGLQYLHDREPPVVHSGMRGDNILITDSGGAVLGGFGLTKALQNSTGNEKIPPAVMTGKTESQRWMAPEMFAEDSPVLQTPSDVWGWAMAALELISGLPPYYQNKQPHTVMLDIRMNKRPQRAKHADFEKYALKPDEMWALLERCWAIEPADRPTIDEVVIELKKMTRIKRTVERSVDRVRPDESTRV
ncbi:hypothetical protein FRC09_005829 [Ceratobasidium sp. 395]|nr:hypothetical protein FRC09_005829 [Ceratobasidium sp. 395]